MASERKIIPGISTPIIGDEKDKFYLNPVWLSGQIGLLTKEGVATPFKSDQFDGGDDPDDPGNPGIKRPQLDDIQKPIKQEIYYENSIAKVKITFRMYVSAEDPVKKFIIASTKPVSQGGTV